MLPLFLLTLTLVTHARAAEEVAVPAETKIIGKLRQLVPGALASSMGLGTLVVGGMLYGLTLFPAVVMAAGGLPSFFSGLPPLGRRSSPPDSPPPLRETADFVRHFARALQRWSTADHTCRKAFICNIYSKVAIVGEAVKNKSLHEAFYKFLHNAPWMRGDLQEAAKGGLRGISCGEVYPCSHNIM